MVHSRGFVRDEIHSLTGAENRNHYTPVKQRATVGVLSIGQISSHRDCRSHLFWPGVVPVRGDLELRAMPVIPQLRLTKTGDRIIYKNGNGVLGWLEDFPFLDSFALTTLSLRKLIGSVWGRSTVYSFT